MFCSPFEFVRDDGGGVHLVVGIMGTIVGCIEAVRSKMSQSQVSAGDIKLAAH